ncbi:uncharacterized protein VNE69_06219 [Vairimorpha necatrix]|uniref:Uncharacterized protein n=1 Tax=Vairimorpha necatrix TaxID=6039 RepID=A0AAX4JDR6_9MICR
MENINKIINSDFQIILKSDVFFYQSSTHDTITQDQNIYYDNDIIKNVDLGIDKPEEIFWFEMDIDKLQKSNLTTSKQIKAESLKVLMECKNKIKKIINETELKFNNESRPSRKNKLDRSKKQKIVDSNKFFSGFRNNYIYRLKKIYLPRTCRLIDIIDVSNNVKNIIKEFVNIFKFLITVHEKREKITHNRNITLENILNTVHYNIKLMSIYDDKQIIETLSKIKEDLNQQNYKNYSIKEEIIILLNSIINNLHILFDKSKKLKEIYEECIESLNK